MKDSMPKRKKTKNQEMVDEQHTNALIFPWTPIDGVDMIPGEKFASSEETGLSEKKESKKTHK